MAPQIESNDVASVAAAEGSHALGVGDTELAKKKYAQAGLAIESESAASHESSRQALLRFLAASQYFHGGDYKQAQKLARRIEARLLPDGAHELFPRFVQDVDDRADPRYPIRMRQKFHGLWSKGQAKEALELLKSHPYILDRTGLAFMRAILCEELKRYPSAAIFHATAMRFRPDDPGLPYLAATSPLRLLPIGRADEAWEYVHCQLEEIDHPAVYISASLLSYRKAVLSTDDEKTRLLTEQVRYFEKAWTGYQQMPSTFQNDNDLRGYMSLCFEIAAFSLWKLGEEKRAEEVCDTAITFDRNYAGFWTIRGQIRQPKPEGIEDLRQSLKLGERNYYPCYYLAQNALEGKQFADARHWIEEALRRNPGTPVRGQLLNWLAICRANVGDATSDEIEHLFTQAEQLAPQIPEIAENHQAFRDFVRSARDNQATVRQWPPATNRITDYPLRDDFPSFAEQQHRMESRRKDALKHLQVF